MVKYVSVRSLSSVLPVPCSEAAVFHNPDPKEIKTIFVLLRHNLAAEPRYIAQGAGEKHIRPPSSV